MTTDQEATRHACPAGLGARWTCAAQSCGWGVPGASATIGRQPSASPEGVGDRLAKDICEEAPACWIVVENTEMRMPTN
jgi:hypothetical protein